MPQFDLSTFDSQLLWLLLVFGFLYFFVSKFIAPKAENIIDERNRFIQDSVSNAEEYSEKAKSLELSYQQKIEEIDAFILKQSQQSQNLLDIHFADKQSELSVTLNNKREKAMADIQSYTEKFKQDRPEFCVKTAAFIIKKVTGKEADINILKEIQGKIK
jgi:F-type H+-transporting ATPase subunit b